MAGLLDDIYTGVIGDEKDKDEYGQTQADRRMPIWSGLVRAGLLAAAGGQKMMPEERARYIAQAGGAIADVPERMLAQRSEYAKQKLQGYQGQLAQQGVETGKQKLANQAKMAAYASSPEGVQALGKLLPHQQFAAKVALDSGDVDAFGRIMTGVDTAANTQQRMGIMEERLKLAQDKQLHGGAYSGQNMEGQMLNMLIRGTQDPAFRATPDYATAYDTLATGKSYVDNQGNKITIDKRPMDRWPAPTFGTAPPAAAPPVAAPGAPPGGLPPPDATAPPMAPGGPAVPPGTPQPPFVGAGAGIAPGAPAPAQMPPLAGPMALAPPVPPGPTAPQVTRTPGAPNVTVTPNVVPFAPAKEDVTKFNGVQAESLVLLNSLEDFRNESRRATGGDRTRSMAGVSTPLTQAWTNAAMMAKGEALYNLGVLNGQDLTVIRGALPDPSTFKGTVGDYENAIDKVVQLVGYKIAVKQAQLYRQPLPKPPALIAREVADQEGGKKSTMPTYNPKTRKFE